MPDPAAQSPYSTRSPAVTEASLTRCTLGENELIAARLAALIAVDTPTVSHLIHIGPAIDAGVTIEQIQDILIAVAPIVGTPRTTSAAAKITEARHRDRRGGGRARAGTGRVLDTATRRSVSPGPVGR